MSARTGHHVEQNLYWSQDGQSDRLIGQVQSPEIARLIVDALNATWFSEQRLHDVLVTLPTVTKEPG